jgi:hypothetical protein
MDIKRLALTLFASNVLLSCTTIPANKSNEEILFYNYGLAVCLGAAFEDKIVKSDFNKSANGYMERGDMPIEAYEELRAAAKRWLEKSYASKHGGQVNSAKCIDFQRSQEISELFKKYRLKERTP